MDEKYLKPLAIALINNPRGTTKDLAEAVGISKATFHRYYGTREHLIEILHHKTKRFMDDIINLAEIPCDDYINKTHDLIKAFYLGNEFLFFICGTGGHGQTFENEWKTYYRALDLFFLNGQQKGFFKIDVSNQALTEHFISTICSIIDAERRGRIATDNVLETIQKIFLYGVCNN